MKLLSLEPESSASANSATSAYLVLFGAVAPRDTACNIVALLVLSRNSPCYCAFSNSLLLPQGALVFEAANSATSAYLVLFGAAAPRDTACNIVTLLIFIRNSPCSCAFSNSLLLPQGALVFEAANSATSAYILSTCIIIPLFY